MGEVNTNCDGCIFAKKKAIVNSDSKYLQQIGCHKHLIFTFGRQGTKILTIENDNHNKSFGLENRVCTYFRNGFWLSFHKLGSLDENLNIVGDVDKCLQAARNEIVLNYSAFIYVDNKSSLTDINTTVLSLLQQSTRPRNITIIANQPNKDLRLYDIHMWCLGNIPKPTTWNIEFITEDNANILRSTDIAVQKCKTTYYCLGHAGYQFLSNYSSDIATALYDKFKQFLLLLPETDDNYNGMFAQTKVTHNIGGNFEKPFIEKMKNVTGIQECQFLVRSLHEICKPQ